MRGVAALLILGAVWSGTAVAQVADDDPNVPLSFEEGIVLDPQDLPPPIEIPEFSKQTFEANNTVAAEAFTQKKYDMARRLAATGAEAGIGADMFLYAHLLRSGLGGAVDTVGAVRWYRAAAQKGEVGALLALAHMAFENQGGLAAGDGRAFLRQAAAKKSVEAKIVLGQVFLSGMGGPLDEEEAKRWFLAAVADGSTEAKRRLADLYYMQGKEAAAVSLYRQAAMDGNARAAYRGGIALADPQGKIHDEAAAAPLLRQAAHAGLPEGMTAWGLYIAHQKPPLLAKAARWFRKGALAGDGEGQYLYAVALAKGEGVLQNREAAYEWAVRAVRDDPEDGTRRDLALALARSLPGPTRARIEEIARQPLLVFANSASLDRNADPR